MRPPTIRRLMIAVAMWALAMSLLIHADDRPGVYLVVGGYGVGVSRNDAMGRQLLPDGRTGGWRYEAGAWSRCTRSRLVAWFRDGEAGLVCGDWWAML
jgi:hypothetical protein